MRYQWDKLNKQQAGAYAEYFVKMEFTMYGFQVYSTEVDDRGIDFVCRHQEGPFLEIQVKSVRDAKYVFMIKDKFKLSKHLWLALVFLKNGTEPKLYLIPSEVWNAPNKIFVSRDYEGKKSNPEWGLNLSHKNLPELEKYEFNKIIEGTLKKKIV
ncbi:MAG TPA: DUF4365 domain-containing protein [candidate division Zixibacteria bacterium]|nr:DUF4365 domain-containing protein [candidate division Zixibacteria bacterium]